MNNEAFARKRLVECCHMLYDRNLTVSAGGNMSVRINDREILITPSGVNKGLVREDDLVKMDMDGNEQPMPRVVEFGKSNKEKAN
jgi:L-fuculose-phosphate aldolase